MNGPDTSRRLAAQLVGIDDRSLDVRTIGELPPSVVFLHEGLGSVDLWRSYPADVAAATEESVVVYSRYGHGWSDVQDGPRPVTFMDREAYVVLPQLIETFISQPPILVGHSDGASIALLHASRHPVAALVLLAPHVFTEPDGLTEVRRAQDRFHTTDLGRRMAKYHRDPLATFNAWRDVWLHPDFEAWNIESVLADISCPVLLIQGEDDEYGTMAQIEAISTGLGGIVDRMLLSACRHSPHLDRPSTTAAATARFIADIRTDTH